MIAALALSVAWFVVSLRWAVRAPTVEQIVLELKEGSQKIAQDDRVLSIGDEEVVVVQRRPARPPVEELGGAILESWGNPLKSPIPEELRKPLILAMQAYRTALAGTSNPADAFLERRRIGSGAREALRLGYAPDEWEFLLKKLQGAASPETLVKAGLALPRKAKGGYYDRFRARLIIPVEYREALCGFIGVNVEGIDPVLLFSPDGPFFTKDVAVEYVRSIPELRAITGL